MNRHQKLASVVSACLLMSACSGPVTQTAGDRTGERPPVTSTARTTTSDLVETVNGANQAIALGTLAVVANGHLARFNERHAQEGDAVLARRLAGSNDELASGVREAYEQTFTAEEMNALLEFYSTPVGHAIAHKSPELMARLGAVGRQYVEEAVQ